MNLEEITYKINGCAMKVHRTLGNGFQDYVFLHQNMKEKYCVSIKPLKIYNTIIASYDTH